MNLDLRVPMGLMFLITGAILVLFGWSTNGSEMYARSMGLNVNLIWGVVLAVFGAIMYTLGVRKQRKIASGQIKPKTVTNPNLRGH